MGRLKLHRLLYQLRKGDLLVVWKLDRLSRSLRDVRTIMERLAEAKAGFRSLTEAIDTTTPAGRMMMQMVGARRPKLTPNNNLKPKDGIQRYKNRRRCPRGYSKSTRPPSRGC